MNYRFIIEDKVVTGIIEDDNSFTKTIHRIEVMNIEEAKEQFLSEGINIDKITEFENELS